MRPKTSTNASMPYRSFIGGHDRGGRRRGEDAAQRVVGVVGARVLLADEVHHHADEVGDRDPALADLVDPPAGREPAADDEPGTGHQRRVRRHELGVAVEQRRDRHPGVVGGQAHQRDALVGEEVHLGVRHRHALARAGGAGGEEHRGQVLRVHLGQCQRGVDDLGSIACSSSSSQGAASQPAARRVASASSRWPVSMTQNLRIVLAASATSTNRAAYTSSTTASVASTVLTWWARKSCS